VCVDAPRASTVRHFAGRWSRPEAVDPAVFQSYGPKLADVFRRWLGLKGRFVYQLEKTLVFDPQPAAALGAAFVALAPPPASHENWHYQCFLYSTDKMRPDALGRLFQSDEDFPLKGFHVQPASDNGKAALKQYCMKKDSRVAGPWADKKIRDEYDGSDIKSYDSLWGWQKHVVEISRKAPDDRHIEWVCNPAGCSGKSTLAKFMETDELCDAFCLGHGKAGDLANLISKNSGHKVYIFDLPRTRPGSMYDSDVCSVIEGIKNGRMINTKYETCSIKMKPPHMWVFSNSLPPPHAWSTDRLRVWSICGTGPDSVLENFDFAAHARRVYKEKVEAAVSKLRAADEKKQILRDAKEFYRIELGLPPGAPPGSPSPVVDKPVAPVTPARRPSPGSIAAAAALCELSPISVSVVPGLHHLESPGVEPECTPTPPMSPWASPPRPKRKYADEDACEVDPTCAGCYMFTEYCVCDL